METRPDAKGFDGRAALSDAVKRGLAALFAALAGVFLVIGGGAALQAAQLSLAGREAHAFWRHRPGGGDTLGFGTESLGHEITPGDGRKPGIIPHLARCLQVGQFVARLWPAIRDKTRRRRPWRRRQSGR